MTTSPPRLFWVTISRDTKVCIAAGPFADHATAATFVDPARRLVNTLHPGSHFDGFGVTSGVVRPGRKPPRGAFNEHLGVPDLGTLTTAGAVAPRSG